MSLSSRLGFAFLTPAFFVAACTSFGTGGDDTPATPDGSIADTGTTATPDTGVVVPPIPTTVPDAMPLVDAAPSKGFCSGFPGALFCSSFDGTAVAEGWDSSKTELGTLALVPSSRSAPNALRATVAGTGNAGRPITYVATPGLSWTGNGVVVDVDIDAAGIPSATVDFYSAINLALSVTPPRFITLAFTGRSMGALFVFDRPDGSSTVQPSTFTRPASGFAHYTIRAHFTQGTVTVTRDGTEVVTAVPGLSAASVQPVFLSAGLEVDPGGSGYVDYDNYVVRQF